SASRLTWFDSHDSSTGTESARNAGTNSPELTCEVAVVTLLASLLPCTESVVGCSWRFFFSPCFSPCLFSNSFFCVSFFSQSRQSALPSETGNPQVAHFCTRRIASGIEAGSLTVSDTRARSAWEPKLSVVSVGTTTAERTAGSGWTVAPSGRTGCDAVAVDLTAPGSRIGDS